MFACLIATKAAASCSDLLIRDSVSVNCSDLVAASSRVVSSDFGEFALASTPTRASNGSAWRNNSSCLPSRSGAWVESPVMFPPGERDSR
jgi:hypothetical protein